MGRPKDIGEKVNIGILALDQPMIICERTLNFPIVKNASYRETDGPIRLFSLEWLHQFSCSSHF